MDRVKKIVEKIPLPRIIKALDAYKVYLISAIISVIFISVVLRINSQLKTETNQEALTQLIYEGRPTKIDLDTIKELERLRNLQITTDAQFDETRTNPFE